MFIHSQWEGTSCGTSLAPDSLENTKLQWARYTCLQVAPCPPPHALSSFLGRGWNKAVQNYISAFGSIVMIMTMSLIRMVMEHVYLHNPISARLISTWNTLKADSSSLGVWIGQHISFNYGRWLKLVIENIRNKNSWQWKNLESYWSQEKNLLRDVNQTLSCKNTWHSDTFVVINMFMYS